MRIRIDDTLSVEVSFHWSNREEGWGDDIRFALRESGPEEVRLFPADEISFMLTPQQAERLAKALMQAAEQSRKAPL